ncbi:MAG: DNA repair protein RadC [Acidobacteria bacterium]|nr:DNA repair protein RadC [Acidobacteriota bacterium]
MSSQSYAKRPRSVLIREMPMDERPRERLLRYGASALSNAELLSILLRSGRPGTSAIDLARELLRQSGGLASLGREMLPGNRIVGVGPTKIAVVLAALELARRLARSEMPDREPMSQPAEVASYLALRYQLGDQEVMGGLYLDTRNRLVAEQEIFRGTLNRVAVEPRAILKFGLLQGAAGIILFHTHPSGDPSPSAEDLAFTRRLAEAGEVVGIRLIDHIILGSPTSWVSLRQRGGW